jgi:heptosyltransferase-1
VRFLIIKSSSYGDIVQCYPVLNYIKKKFPKSTIDWVVEERVRSLVEAHPLVDSSIVIDTKKWKKKWWHPAVFCEILGFFRSLRKEKYEAVFDLQGNLKSAVITLLSRSGAKVGFGWKTAHERLSCVTTSVHSIPPRGQNIRRDYLFIVQSYFKEAPSYVEDHAELCLSPCEIEQADSILQGLELPCWMVCPGAFWKNKKLPEACMKKFLSLCHEAYGASFLFVSGSGEEKKEIEGILSYFHGSSKTVHRPSAAVLQYLMKRMELVIAMDSFPLHLAGSSGTPTFSLFGPTVSFKFRPLGDAHFSYQGSCPYLVGFEKRCPSMRTCKTGACMGQIDPVQLFAAFSNWWSRER